MENINQKIIIMDIINNNNSISLLKLKKHKENAIKNLYTIDYFKAILKNYLSRIEEDILYIHYKNKRDLCFLLRDAKRNKLEKEVSEYQLKISNLKIQDLNVYFYNSKNHKVFLNKKKISTLKYIISNI